LVIGATPFGIIFGALAINSGISATGASLMSALVFAGSAQFIATGLVANGAAPSLIVLTTFVVNLRHALYAASLAPFLKHLPQGWLALLGFWLTDDLSLSGAGVGESYHTPDVLVRSDALYSTRRSGGDHHTCRAHARWKRCGDN
jgi:hypothetical protein